jgi:ketosteroid isomerase-like protein
LESGDIEVAEANVSTIRALYDAVARGDAATVLSMLDPGAEWNESEGFVYSGQYVGRDAIQNGVLERLATEWDGYRAVPEDFLDAGTRVAALGWYSGTYKATGKSFRARFADVWTLRDAKIVHLQQYADTAKINEAVAP